MGNTGGITGRVGTQDGSLPLPIIFNHEVVNSTYSGWMAYFLMVTNLEGAQLFEETRRESFWHRVPPQNWHIVNNVALESARWSRGRFGLRLGREKISGSRNDRGEEIWVKWKSRQGNRDVCLTTSTVWRHANTSVPLDNTFREGTKIKKGWTV